MCECVYLVVLRSIQLGVTIGVGFASGLFRVNLVSSLKSYVLLQAGSLMLL